METTKERKDYNSYLDDVHSQEEASEKISAIREKIGELKEDPKQVKMVKYLNFLHFTNP